MARTRRLPRGDVFALFPDGEAGQTMYFRVFTPHAVSPSMNATHETKLGS